MAVVEGFRVLGVLVHVKFKKNHQLLFVQRCVHIVNSLYFSLRERAFRGALAALDFAAETDEAIVTNTHVVGLVAHVATSNARARASLQSL